MAESKTPEEETEAPKKAAAKKAPAKKAAEEKAEAPAKKTAAKKAPAKAAAKKAEEKEEKVALLRVHHLKPAPGAKKDRTRVGRGEGSKGKTSGRGTKGTKARYQVPARFEGGQMPMHMRLPKLRGFKNPFRVEFQVVNLDRLTATFPEGGTLTVEDLVNKGLVRPKQPVKVLGTGEAGAKFDLTVDAWSDSAKSKIEAAGGSLTAR